MKAHEMRLRNGILQMLISHENVTYCESITHYEDTTHIVTDIV